MLLLGTFLVTLLGCCAALGVVLTTYEEDSLVVEIVNAPANSIMLLVRLPSDASGCMDTEAATVEQELVIQVVSNSGNITSQQPLELKDEHPDNGGFLARSEASWNTTVFLQGSYTDGTIETRGNLFENELPQCKELRVALWEAKSSGLDQLVRCNEDIFFVAEKTMTIAVTPLQCGPGVEYITIYSKVVELPSALEGSGEPTGEALWSRLLWLLLLPLLFVAAVFIALGAIWVRRRYRLARNKTFILASPLATYRKYRVDAGPPVVKVVYSRDSESHVAAVSRLCELLRRELGFRVEWDEAAMHLAHVTPDWAMAMAQLSCPQFNSTAKTAPTVKMLVIESDGALLKHKAYRNHKDLGLVSDSNVDELYHTTYAALLSNHAQALGDYCHIMVARLPYTTLPDRLDLVPEKRYQLPEHLPLLLQALLYKTKLPVTGAESALHSETYTRFTTALADAGKFDKEKGFAENSICAKLRAILAQY
ncbi:uncharacterized protein LOC119163181 isoform X2 [Rhipicephalus microplus]|uniref:uncharacterized protein LOC119163181 isoform X2 n=1 Tax=Rhipicephalus microplus TaxID=6941 RepID=UPI003F6ADC66